MRATRVIVFAAATAVLVGGVIVVARDRSDRTAPAALAATTTSVSPTTLAPATTLPATTVPTTTTMPAATPTTVAGKVVVIDPGHNEGNARHTAEINREVDVVTERKPCDTTGTATDDGYSEAAFTTELGNRVAALLRAAGVTVVMTRDASTPWGPCITERAAIGNAAHADAAVSIHADGGPAEGHGFHVIEPALVAGHNDDIIAPSHVLAIALRDAYQQRTAIGFSTYLGHDGIDRRDDLGGLNLSTVPKVFIECGNMRNANDAGRLEDGAFRGDAAAGIADGILAFLQTG